MTRRAADKDLFTALTLTHSLLCRWRVLPPAGNFLSSAKESHQRTPQGTDGSLTSFALLRQIRKPLNVVLPLRLTRSTAYFAAKVERCAPTFLSRERLSEIVDRVYATFCPEVTQFRFAWLKRGNIASV